MQMHVSVVSLEPTLSDYNHKTGMPNLIQVQKYGITIFRYRVGDKQQDVVVLNMSGV